MHIDWLSGEPWPCHTIPPQDSGSHFNQASWEGKKKLKSCFKNPKPRNAIDARIYLQENKVSVAQAFPLKQLSSTEREVAVLQKHRQCRGKDGGVPETEQRRETRMSGSSDHKIQRGNKENWRFLLWLSKVLRALIRAPGRKSCRGAPSLKSL